MSFWGRVLDIFVKVLPEPAPRPSGLYPPFEAAIKATIKEARSQGLLVGLQKGIRSFEEQDELYAKGRTKPGNIVTNAKAGFSTHNYGIGGDIVFQVNEKWSWSDKHDWKKLGAIGKKHGLEWGGDWKKLKDLPHFQWPTELSLSQMRSLYLKGGLESVWEEI